MKELKERINELINKQESFLISLKYKKEVAERLSFNTQCSSLSSVITFTSESIADLKRLL
jgi:hypothetical protein